MKKNQDIESGISSEVDHIPLSEKTLVESVQEKISENNPLPDYSGRYEIWKEAYNSGNWGFFECEVSEIVDIIEESLNGNPDSE